ncbi:PAS domain S-box protein, partial [[Clostridium] asparagiforme DSM 15981]
MGNVTLAEVESLARKILTTYFCDSDLEFLISTFADDIIWLGGGEKQKAEGKEAVAACFRSGKDGMIACDMSDETYHCMDLGGGAYLCEGVSWLRSKPGSEFYINMQQRVTFVFRETDEGLKAVHIHNSVPYQAIKEDELFPIESSREEFIRLQSALNIKNQEFENQAQFLERLYNTIPCGILQFTTDPSHRVVALNPMTWKFYGYDSEEAYRRHVTSPLDNVEAEDRGRVLAAIGRLTLNGENVSYRRRCVRRDGQEVWISVVMGRIVNSDGLEVIQAVFTDITEQMRLEKAQEQERILENRFLRAAIYTAYPLIMSLNLTRDTYSLFVDEQDSYTIQGEGTYTDLVENSLPMIYPSYQEDYRNTFRREEILRRFEAGEQEIYMEMQQIGDDGEYHWLSVHVIAVENPFNDDVLAIDLVKLLDSQRQEQARQQQLLRDALTSANAASRAK